MRQLRRILLFTAGLVFLLALDSGFIPALGAPLQWLNITLIASLYLVTVLRSDVALVLWGGMILLQALTVSSLFFIPLICGFAVLLLLDRLIERFFTNRSYYVIVVLSLAGWLIYHGIYLLLVKVLEWLSPEAVVPIVTTTDLMQILFLVLPVTLIVSTAFLLTSSLSRRFRSYFIIANHS